jgi:hypothetical protein
MKYLVVVIFFLGAGFNLFAQIEPVQNSDTMLRELKVKSISSFHYTSKDTTKATGRLVFKKEFDRHGKVTKKYVLSLWEAVSYDNSTDFRYNEKEQLIEESKIQSIQNLENRDQEYINSFGDTPLHEKITYGYNLVDELVSKDIYTFSTDELSESALPVQKIIYEYDSALLSFEKSSSTNTRVFNQNYTIDYAYDDQGNLIKKILTYGSEMDKKRISTLTYSIDNRLVEERVEDSGIPRNNIHTKYEYNESGLLKSKLGFDVEEEDFVVDIGYEYDSHGNRISGEKEVEFTYYENGLIRSELWKDETNDQVFFFVSKYEFY